MPLHLVVFLLGQSIPTSELPDAVSGAFVADDGEGGDDVGDDGESEARAATAPCEGSPRYSADLSDAELERRFTEDLGSLGSISVGFADAGRIINGVALEAGDAWEVVSPSHAFGADETIEAIRAVARAVQERYPEASPLRVNHISKQEGGYLRPHKSHQSGRDVDLGFYYLPGVEVATLGGARLQLIEPAANWALVRALVTLTDVQAILVDRSIAKALHAEALREGEDQAWVDGIFSGPSPIVQHARRHRDHFHVRFFAPRSQELGRRVQPILMRRPDENLAMVRVRPGDTLGHIALRYDSTVKLIQSQNGLRGSFLRVGRVLAVPLRGPCTRCPLPPPVVVPARRLPPAPPSTAQENAAADLLAGYESRVAPGSARSGP